MAITKENYRTSQPKFVEDSTGALADLKVLVTYDMVEDGKALTSISREVSVWARLTASQKLTVADLYTEVKALAVQK